MIDVLVLNYNDSSTTISFVESVKNYSNIYRILIVDNCSTDDSYERLSTLSSEKVNVIKTDKNGGYGYGNNYGIKYLKEKFNSEYILLCNPDVYIKAEICEKLESFLADNLDYSIVAPFMLNARGEKQKNTAFRIPSKWEYILSIDCFFSKFTDTFYYKDIKEEKTYEKDVGSVTGSLFLMRVNDMLQYGMYDENVFLYCEELILGIKLKNSCKKTALLTDCFFIHNHSVSINKTYKSLVAKHKLFMKSKLYTIRHYFDANFIENFIAFILSKLSVIEIFLIGFLKHENNH